MDDVKGFAWKAGDITVALDAAESVCFVMQQNNAPVFRSLAVRNAADCAATDIGIRVSSSPAFFEDLYFKIPALEPGAEHVFTDIKAVLDFNFLSTASEKLRADIIIETEAGGEPLAKTVKRIDLLAFDEWQGYGILPELLASFCTPADPAVNMIISEASQLLKAEGVSFDGYQSGDINRVNKQIAAIYSVIQAKNIAYCMPPASFERSGQKVRLPQAVLKLGLGTCLDTTMLFCACAEAAGLNPLVFIFNGHAFPAFWLTDATFGECVNDDLSEVRKRMASGMSQLTALESTAVTDKNNTYTDAQTSAKARLEDSGNFVMYIDIARARKAGILPLPVRYEADGRYFVDRGIYEAQRPEVRSMRVVDVELVSGGKGGRFEKWKRDLLDITLRNPLVNYRINKAGVPLLNFDLEALEDAFADGKQFTVYPHPKEITKRITDITRLCVDNDPTLTEVLRNELAAGRLRSALNEGDLSARLTTLYRSARLALEESGASNLYIALGFLKWQEKDKPNIDRFAPIVLLPAELVRRSAKAGYTVRMTDDEPQVNLSLIEMLRVNFAIDASGLRDLPRGGSGIDMTKAFTFLRRLIIDQKGWDVTESASLGIFRFASFVLWNDLNVREAHVRSHPLTASLIEAKNHPGLFRELPPADRVYLPLDSDSSQTRAAREAAAGRTFVLHGPPGTGKSQTITNIIANAMAQGKRVLFVAEKKAALDVVRTRLERLGLIDFCLELDSGKGQKKSFYEQFDRLLELQADARDVGFENEAVKLDTVAAELEAFNAAMHTPRGIGASVYEGIDKVIEAGEPEGEVFSVRHYDITADEYSGGVDALLRAANMGKAVGEPVNSPFYGCAAKDYSFELRDSVLQLSRALTEGFESFLAALSSLESELQSKKQPHGFRRADVISDTHKCLSETLYYADKSGLTRFFAGLFGSRRRALGKMTHFKRISRLVKERPEEARHIFAGLDSFIRAEKELRGRLSYGGRFSNADDWAFEIFNAANVFTGGISALKDYCLYNTAREKCAIFPQLNEAVEKLHTGVITSDELIPLFVKSFWQSWLIGTVSADTVLAPFSQNDFRTKRDKFKAYTEFVAELTKKEIYLRMAANLPNFEYASMASSETGILLKAVKSKGRGITIRQLFEKIPALLARVKPCMLMSPLSAAQYLPPDFPQFDLVVFDEASQLLTAVAAGAASRGDAVVMVGDPNQLPPTTFFMARQEDADAEFEMQDLESILDDMLALNAPHNRLDWHYRSEHESLIAFSNTNFYDNKLITFPSVDDQRSRVVFRKVDGIYERGTTRTNPLEAEAVVDELFRSLRDPKLCNQSYGIVTFNITQQTLIEDMIDKRLTAEPALEKYFSCPTPVFVKNIENVQGDERDVIIFSITYGCGKDGKMTVNFGPVNKDGGWRRLNVAITRACKKIIVFSSITPDMIDLSRTTARGVYGLKEFLSYALDGRKYFKRAAGGTAGAFVKAVADALKAAGYKTTVNIGSSKNKIDIAVADKEGSFILGILCDSRAAAETDVRDREYGREKLLKRLGWKLARVYAVEWWENPQEELKRLIRILEAEEHSAEDVAEEIKREIAENHREIELNPAIPLPRADYTAASLTIRPSEAFYEYNSAGEILADIQEIIAQEQPISEQSLYKKIAAAWSISRMTQKFNEYMGQLLKRVPHFANTTQNTKFFWQSAAAPASVEVFRDNSDGSRKAEDICKEEFAVAAHYIMKNALSIGTDDLVRETAKLFGFTKTPAATARINYALSMLIMQGRIAKDGEQYRLK